jgi:membrane protein implicated in regulation of membrane protease activity
MEMLRRTWLLWTGVLAIIIGYVLLAAGRLSAGPLLLVAGYCGCLPLFLWRSFRRRVGE